MKKLQVPYNLDIKMIDVYETYKNNISEVYFTAPPSIFPTARQFDIDEDFYLEDCCYLCKRMSDSNIDTMLLLNGVNVELTREVFGQLHGLIETFLYCGLKGIIVANPIIAHWAHKSFPNIKIRLSVLSNIYSLQKIKQIENLGYIQEICLPQDLNRNEDELKKIRENTSLKLSIIVNSACRINCPLFGWHHMAFNSNSNWNENEFNIIRNNFYEQTHEFNSNQFYSPWVLPSELYYYDRYIDSFKLEDRTSSSEELTNYIYYYSWRIDPDKFFDFLHGSCLRNRIENFNPHNIPKNWLIHRRNCKGECWHCSACDNLYSEIKNKEEKIC